MPDFPFPTETSGHAILHEITKAQLCAAFPNILKLKDDANGKEAEEIELVVVFTRISNKANHKKDELNVHAFSPQKADGSSPEAFIQGIDPNTGRHGIAAEINFASDDRNNHPGVGADKATKLHADVPLTSIVYRDAVKVSMAIIDHGKDKNGVPRNPRTDDKATGAQSYCFRWGGTWYWC